MHYGKNICHTCELGKWENAYLTYEVGEFLDKVVAQMEVLGKD